MEVGSDENLKKNATGEASRFLMFAKKMVLIFLFGGLGSVLRYLTTGWAQGKTNANFPVGTLTVNVIGCAIIGFLASFFDSPRLIREEYRLAAMVGLIGGFTTFSSFALETFKLGNGREFASAGLNVLLSNGLGLVAVFLAYRVGAKLFGV